MQEIPLGNVDFSWFTDGFYLKGDSGKYCAEYTIRNTFDVVEATSLPMATSAQQAKLYTLTWTCTLDRDKTDTIYTDSIHAFGVAHDFVMLWKQHDFLASSGNKILNGPCFKNY